MWISKLCSCLIEIEKNVCILIAHTTAEELLFSNKPFFVKTDSLLTQIPDAWQNQNVRSIKSSIEICNVFVGILIWWKLLMTSSCYNLTKQSFGAFYLEVLHCHFLLHARLFPVEVAIILRLGCPHVHLWNLFWKLGKWINVTIGKTSKFMETSYCGG